MSCLPPDQMPFEQEGRSVILYPTCQVGVDQEQREVAIVLTHLSEQRPEPAVLLTEKEAAQLILQLQSSLVYLRQLPVTPYSPLD